MAVAVINAAILLLQKRIFEYDTLFLFFFHL